MESQYQAVIDSLMDGPDFGAELPEDQADTPMQYLLGFAQQGIQYAQERLARLTEALGSVEAWEAAEDLVETLQGDVQMIVDGVEARARIARAILADAKAVGFVEAVPWGRRMLLPSAQTE